jgi:aerobic carbon-monoxide dehydrogenase medium subunit
MKPPPFKYVAARTVDEALGVLSSEGDQAKILAGGQSLTPMLNFRLAHPEVLVDINRIKELEFVAERDGELAIGCLSRHRTIETSSSIRKHCPILCAAAEQVAHVAIRTRGTFGGSLAHADPAAEFPVIALLLDATMNIRGPKGTRSLPAREFFVNLFSTALEPDELLVDVRVPRWSSGGGWGFRELSRRPGDFAIAVVATAVTMERGKFKEVRISMGGVGPTALRATKAESLLQGQAPDDAALLAAGRAASEASDPPSDLHGSAEYRRHVVEVLTQRALKDAIERATAS